jgi:hypothetical protein
MVSVGVKSNNTTQVSTNSKGLISDEKTSISNTKTKNFQDINWNDPKPATNITKAGLTHLTLSKF